MGLGTGALKRPPLMSRLHGGGVLCYVVTKYEVEMRLCVQTMYFVGVKVRALSVAHPLTILDKVRRTA